MRGKSARLCLLRLPYRASFTPQYEVVVRLESALHWLRGRQRALTRAVLALFCLAWLQAAALPCVMAHAAASDAAASHPCPYCPSSDTPAAHCDEQGSCAYSHQPQVDARAAASLFILLPAVQVVHLAAATAPDYRAPASAPVDPVPHVPLAVTYCRFIE